MSESLLSEADREQQLKRVEACIKQHNDMLVGWLAGKLGDRDTARDVAQDACLRVWRYAHASRIEAPQALLFKTAANLAANEFKARRRHRARHVEAAADRTDDLLDAIASDAPAPDQAFSARGDLERSLSALSSLPMNTRRAFLMSRFQEMGYRDIAKTLGVSVSSVEKYIITALKTLRAALDEEARNTPNRKNTPANTVIPFPEKRKD